MSFGHEHFVRTVNPKLLQKTLKILRERFSPEEIDIDEDTIIFLSNPERRNLLLRIPIKSTSDTVPKSIILKQSLDDDDAYSRFSRDWAGLEFANKIQRSVNNVPLFYCGDKEHRFILIEDLGEQHVSLVDSLTLPNRPDKAVLALGRYMKALGSFHAASFNRTNEYEKILGEINEKASCPQEDLESISQDLLPRLIFACQALNLTTEESFNLEVQEVLESMFLPGPFTVLVHGDIAPDNVFDHEEPKGLQLIDFEWSFPRNALLDGTYLRMCIPTGWCAKAIPEDVRESLELIYREQLKESIPSAHDDRAFAIAYTQACAYHALHEMANLTHILEKDILWGSGPLPQNLSWDPDTNSRRSRFLSRLQAFVDVATEHNLLPNLKQMAEIMLTKVKELWPDAKPLDYYAAFQAPNLKISALLSNKNLGFFGNLEKEFLTEHRHDSPELQHEFDKLFGLVLKK